MSFLQEKNQQKTAISCSLRKILPSVPEIVWMVDGEDYETTAYPYESRWMIEEGSHTFQARFPRARVFSDVVSLLVLPY